MTSRSRKHDLQWWPHVVANITCSDDVTWSQTLLLHWKTRNKLFFIIQITDQKNNMQLGKLCSCIILLPTDVIIFSCSSARLFFIKEKFSALSANCTSFVPCSVCGCYYFYIVQLTLHCPSRRIRHCINFVMSRNLCPHSVFVNVPLWRKSQNFNINSLLVLINLNCKFHYNNNSFP